MANSFITGTKVATANVCIVSQVLRQGFYNVAEVDYRQFPCYDFIQSLDIVPQKE